MHGVLGVDVRTYLSYPCTRLTEGAYSNLDCGGTETWAFDYPGDATGGLNLPEPFNDAIGSFKCLQGRC